jgi:hypothetical protein
LWMIVLGDAYNKAFMQQPNLIRFLALKYSVIA